MENDDEDRSMRPFYGRQTMSYRTQIQAMELAKANILKRMRENKFVAVGHWYGARIGVGKATGNEYVEIALNGVPYEE